MHIFYDGNCIICTRTMQKYKKLLARTIPENKSEYFFVDTTHENFIASDFGLDEGEIKKAIFVLEDGIFYRGLSALMVIWRKIPMPYFRFILFLLRNPFFLWWGRVIYFLFAKYRVYLPKNKKKCIDDYCRL